MLRIVATFLTLAAIAPAALAGEKPVVLKVVSRDLPARFSPYGPLTDADRRALDLVFEPLIAVHRNADGSLHSHPSLAEAIPSGQGSDLTFRLRAGAVWSNGDKMTANDIRHSLRHLQQDAGAERSWGLFLDPPQVVSPREVHVKLRHGMLDPWELFTFPIVPQLFQGRDLNPQTDADFARHPLGSGPFTFAGPLKNADIAGVVFRKNSHHPRADRIPWDEIHWFATSKPKDIARLNPDLALDLDPADAGGLSVKSTLTPRVWQIAVNQRRPLLQQQELRRFLGLSLERDKILGANPRLSVTGLTPRDSWTQARPPRVPDDLYQPEVARSLAAGLAKSQPTISLSLKFPADQAAKMTPLIAQWEAAAKAENLNLKIQPIPLNAAAMAQALDQHDFDLALTYEDHGDSISRLTALFDPRNEALAPGGANVLGVRDAKLGAQIAGLWRTRQFPALRDQLHNLHVHLVQTMPFIPLWQHRAHYALAGDRVQPFDPLRPFADLSAWRK